MLGWKRCGKLMIMNPTVNKIPPHSVEAEQSFLGAILIDPDAMDKVADHVDAEMFYFEKNGHVFAAMLDLFTRHEPIDLLSLGNRLEEMGKLEQVGGRSYLAELTNVVPTASNVAHYGDIIQKKATLRKLISASSRIAEMGYQDTAEDVARILDDAETTLFAVAKKHLKQSFVHVRSVLSDAFERIDMLHKERGKLRGVGTGYTGLDDLLSGLQKSDLVILAARPSVGKTSLALAIARHAAVRGKVPVGIFSLEMSKEQLVDRLICAEANIDLWRLRTGKLSDRDSLPRIGQALGVLSGAAL